MIFNTNEGKIHELIEQLDCPQNLKDRILEEARSLEKEARNSDFKFKRTLKDKQIVTNILNETIKSLEEKSAALTEQARKLKEQSQFKEELFANVSHELRTPLHGILGMSHLLGKTTLNTIQKEYVGVVKGSADNLLVIINDILSLSQINAGKIEITEEPFSVHKFLKELEGMLSVRAKNQGLQLSFLTSPSIPKYLVGDRTRVFQVLLNLLNNSIKFTHQGYILLSTEIKNISGSEMVLQFEIKDTGIGMKKDKLSTIFESFTRVHEARGIVYEGAGLGLNIVKNLLNLMGGTIEVESEINKGTTFKVGIPFGIPEPSVVQDFKNAQEDATIPEEWKQVNFLMIEDNTANILYAKDIFESWGLKLDIAESLEEARDRLTTQYDCILSDVKLPDGDGLEFVKELKADNNAVNQNTPIIILTASANQNGADLAREVNIQSYLSKPFPPDLLVRELKRILDTENNKHVVEERKEVVQEENNEDEKISQDFLENLSKRFKGRTNLMAEMAKIFMDQASNLLNILSEAPAKENYEIIRFESHKFKSTVNIIGLEELRAFASKTEESCFGGKPLEDISQLINDFKIQIKSDMKKVTLAIDLLLLTEQVA